MYNMTFKNNNQEYKRINKTQAKKIYNAGGAVVFCPSNLRPFGPWACGCFIDNSAGDPFESVYNRFYYYNCNNGAGRSINFFVEV